MHSDHIDMVNKEDHGNLVKYAGENRTEIMKLRNAEVGTSQDRVS